MIYLILKRGFTARALFFILAFGLLSCRRDKKVDVYRPEAVVLRHTHDFRANALSSSPYAVDVQDILDPAAAHAKRMIVDCDCKNGKSLFQRSTEWAGEPVTVSNVLPTELKPFSSSQLENLNCNFAITLFNAEGSSFHDLHLRNRSVIDGQEHLIRIEESPETLVKEQFISWKERQFAKLFWSHEPNTNLQLSCESFQGSSLNPAQKFSLAEVANADTNSEEFKSKILIKPRQSCRIFSVRDQRSNAMSDSFDLAFDLPSIEADLSLTPSDAQGFQELVNGVPHVLANIYVRNTGDVRRTLRIPIQPSRVFLELFGTFDDSFLTYSGKTAVLREERRWGTLVPCGANWAPLPELARDASYRYFELAASQLFIVRLYVQGPSTLGGSCNAGDKGINLGAAQVMPLVYDDLAINSGSGKFESLKTSQKPQYYPQNILFASRESILAAFQSPNRQMTCAY